MSKAETQQIDQRQRKLTHAPVVSLDGVEAEVRRNNPIINVKLS
jgi:hypothetical protein